MNRRTSPPPQRPIALMVLYPVAGLSAVTWGVALFASHVSPQNAIGMGEGGALSSGARVAVLTMTFLAAAITVGLHYDLGWTRPLIPISLAMAPLLANVRGAPLDAIHVAQSLALAAIVGLYLYTWPSAQRYYAAIRAGGSL